MIHSKSKGTYGSPRITKELNVSGTKISQKTVARIMRKNKIRSKIKKKFKITTGSKHKCPISPNLLKQEFLASKKTAIWLSTPDL